MARISRFFFISLCNKEIKKSREMIVIRNQKSGYLKFHKAIRDEKCFGKFRAIIKKVDKKDYLLRHEMIDYFKLGNCSEIAQYLLVQLGKSLVERGVDAEIERVDAQDADHCFLRVKIHLLGEKSPSTWIVDSWDPRVIDISMKKDGSVKNINSLKPYGYNGNVVTKLKTLPDMKEELAAYSRKRKHHQAFFKIELPKEGTPQRAPTPEKELFSKHPKLYEDYTIKDAFESGKMSDSPDLMYLQQVSNWQLR
jgi:hypothetical protein